MKPRSLDIKKLARPPKGHCRWCMNPVAKGRRSYCSEACKIDFYVRAFPSSAAFYVKQRDRGTCAMCEIDTEWLRVVWKLLRGPWHHEGRFDEWKRFGAMLSGLDDTIRRWWEMDHTIPVVEGGGACGLDNLRTLCVPCHWKVTKELAGRRAAAARDLRAELFANTGGE